MLPIYGQTSDEIKSRLWFLDTGDEDCLGIPGYGCVMPDQVDWFRQEHLKITDTSKGRGMLFMHIPIDEYMGVVNDGNIIGHKNEGICCGAVNTGIYGAMVEQPTVEWVSCGHDHFNDFYGEYQGSGITLGYGRKTGFGSDGPYFFPRGARVFEMTEEPYGIETWVREDGGNRKV